MDDWQLLREFVDKDAQGAFEALVGRYVQMVYGIALREVREHHLAEDVTQAVFAILARKAPTLPETAVIAGWLFRTTRFTAANALKMQRRRRFHEDRAGRMREMLGQEDPREERLRELDGALARLGEKDRGAVLMRYYRRMEIADVGRALGVSEGTARRRVERAVGKMRRWIKTGDVGMVGIIGATGIKNVSQMATQSLASAKGGAGVGESVNLLMKGALKMMYWAKLKLAAMVIVSVAVVGGAGIVTVQKLAAEAPQDEPPAVVIPPSAANQQFAALDQEVQKRRHELAQFKQSHSILSNDPMKMETEFLAQMNSQLLDLQLQQAEAQLHLDAAKKQAQAGIAVTGDAQAAVDAIQAKIEALAKMRNTQEVVVRDLDYFTTEYERMKMELDALEKVRLDLLVKVELEKAAQAK